jgi:hypothetical protein
MPLFWLNLLFKAVVWPQMTFSCEVKGRTRQIYLKKLKVSQNRIEFWHFEYLVTALFLFLINLSRLNSWTLLLLIELNLYSIHIESNKWDVTWGHKWLILIFAQTKDEIS